MATQADVDALTATVQAQGQTIGQVSTAAQAAQAALQNELNSLKAQINSGEVSDLTALQNAVAANGSALTPLVGVVEALSGLTPQS